MCAGSQDWNNEGDDWNKECEEDDEEEPDDVPPAAPAKWKLSKD